MPPLRRSPGLGLARALAPLAALAVLAALGLSHPVAATAATPEGPEATDEEEGKEEENPEDAAEETTPGEADAASAAAPAPEPSDAPLVEVHPKDKRIRHNGYFGFGFGGGISGSRVKAGNIWGLEEGGSTQGAAAGFLHAGGRVDDRLAIGGRINSFSSGTVSSTGLLVEALIFPMKDRGLILGVAVGPSLLFATASRRRGDPDDSDDSGDSDGSEEPISTDRRPGLGLAAEIGYDFWILRRFNIGLILQANAAINPRQATGLMSILGLQFNWY